MQFAYQFPQLVDRLILVARAVSKDTSTSSSGWPRCPWAAGYNLPLVLPAVQIAGRIVGARVVPTWGYDTPNVPHFGRPARADGFCGVRPHPAERGGLAGADGRMLDRC